MIFRPTVMLCLALAGLSPGVAEQRLPNILMIVSEDNGPELGCYGDPYARTPHLDQLAKEGVRFANAFVPYSICSPSRAAFLTGLHSHQNGQVGLATHKFAMYDEATPNVATILRPAGYLTGLVGKLHVNPESAFPFDFRAIPSANFSREYKASEYVDAAKSFWAEADEAPWFLSMNFPDAHLPFSPQSEGRPAVLQTGADVTPLPWAGADSERLRDVTADYYNCMARMDDWVGLLLAELERSGQAENTLVIYFGDHGAQFARGKGSVYEAGLKIPLIVRWPGHAEVGAVRPELTTVLDIVPTIVAATGVDSPPYLTGRALQPLLRGDTPKDWRRYVFALTTGSFPRACFVQHSVRDDRYHLISSPRPGTYNLDAGTYLDPDHWHFVITGLRPAERAGVSPEVEEAYRRWENPPRYELYDLEQDPLEWSNLAESPAHAEIKDRLIGALQDWQHRTRDPFSDQNNVDDYVAEQLSQLENAYREDDNFRWNHIDDFAAWRDARIDQAAPLER